MSLFGRLHNDAISGMGPTGAAPGTAHRTTEWQQWQGAVHLLSPGGPTGGGRYPRAHVAVPGGPTNNQPSLSISGFHLRGGGGGGGGIEPPKTGGGVREKGSIDGHH